MNSTSFQWSSCDGEPAGKRNPFVTESAILERPWTRGCYEPSLPEVLNEENIFNGPFRRYGGHFEFYCFD